MSSLFLTATWKGFAGQSGGREGLKGSRLDLLERDASNLGRPDI